MFQPLSLLAERRGNRDKEQEEAGNPEAKCRHPVIAQRSSVVNGCFELVSHPGDSYCGAVCSAVFLAFLAGFAFLDWPLTCDSSTG
jgi:hypothetical protein